MFQHPSHTAQFAADHRLAARAVAAGRRARRAGGRAAPAVADPFDPTRAAPAGFHDTGADIAAAVRRARRRGVGLRLAAIVADPTQPDVARERALGRLVAALTAPDTAARRSTSQPAA
jgi:hypothetical protein